MQTNDLINKLLKDPGSIKETMQQAQENAAKQIAKVKDQKQRAILEQALSIAGNGDIQAVRELLLKLHD